MTRRSLAFIVLAVVGAGGAAVWFARSGADRLDVDTAPVTRQSAFRATVAASGEIIAARYADIGSSVMGKIVSLPVREGARVSAGQVLAQIDPVQAQSDAAGARAQVSALEADAQAAAEQVKAARADLTAAEARARDASQQFARRGELFRQGLVAAADLDSVRAAADAATAAVAAARATVDRAAQAEQAAIRRVAQARAQLTRATDVFEKTSVVSPIDGVVSRLSVREGEMVVVGIQNQPGTTLMTVSDLEKIDAEVKVAEADVLRVALGQPAAVTLEALPGVSFSGRVIEIGASALPMTAGAASAREFRVVIRLDDPRTGLRPGMTCDAEIVTTERAHALTVPLQSVVLRAAPGGGDRTGVFVVENGVARFTPVTAGVIGGLAIEVTGLPEGAEVVAGPYQVLRELSDGARVRLPRER